MKKRNTTKRQKVISCNDIEAAFLNIPENVITPVVKNSNIEELIRTQLAIIRNDYEGQIVQLRAEICSLSSQYQNLEQHIEKMFFGVFERVGETVLEKARETVRPMLDDVRSEVFAHVMDIRDQMNLLAKKTTKWCVVCYERENIYAFMPCRHKCVCKECAKRVYEKYEKCPICRRKVSSAVAIYDASANIED